MEPLIERARSGDATALEELLASVAPSIHRFGMRMCRNASDADDVLQDTLLAVATHLCDFEGRSSLSSWVFTLARTACSRRRRGIKNKPAAELVEATDASPTPEQAAQDRELAVTLDRAIDDLTDEHREVIALRDIEGLSALETAAALGVSVATVKSRLHRAREVLRTVLRPITRPGPTCPDVVALWSKKLEGDLSTQDCAAMEEHVKVCAACSAACDELKAALLACRRSATTELSPEIKARVVKAVRALPAL